VKLIEPLEAEGTYSLKLTYVVQLPFDKFTRYGYTDINDFKLRYWYITPALYDGEWQYYSNKNLNDLFTPKTVASELDFVSLEQANDNQTVTLTGKDRVDSKLMLTKLPTYKSVQTDYFTIISNVETKNLSSLETVMVTDKITKFLVDNLGAYPHEKLLLTQVEYRNDPIYGLNLLPDFIKPYPNTFQYELKLLKTALNNYLKNTLLLNPRKEQWLLDGLQTYYLIKYIEDLVSKYGANQFRSASRNAKRFALKIQ